MRAVVIHGPSNASVEEVPEPIAAAGQVVVDVARVGVCGTDTELYTGRLAYYERGKSHFPLRPGHEWCGTVSAIGEGVDRQWLGARVTGDTMLGCGHCYRCRDRRGHVCEDRYEIGIMGGWHGALAEKLLIPANFLYRLPDEIDDTAGALIEPGGNAWRAATAANPGAGRRVLICGPGTIGLLSAAFVKAMGGEVHILGLDDTRRELAEQLLGEHVHWTTQKMPDTTFDAVIDCTDYHKTVATVLPLIEPGGRLVCIGVSSEPSFIDTRDLVLNDITAVGILGASAGLAPAIEEYATGRVKPKAIVGITVGLDQAVDALAGNIKGHGGTKVHIDPRK
jgi:2-desacetyl-2-hydroxyethyl bacteriochlorophyllide A dehydrogenase